MPIIWVGILVGPHCEDLPKRLLKSDNWHRDILHGSKNTRKERKTK